jgi:hypothetical protein
LSPSQLWVAGSLSPYDVIIYLFCIELLLYSKDVTFVSIPRFIICVRLGPSTPGDYVRARVLVLQNSSVTFSSMGGAMEHLIVGSTSNKGRRTCPLHVSFTYLLFHSFSRHYHLLKNFYISLTHRTNPPCTLKCNAYRPLK